MAVNMFTISACNKLFLDESEFGSEMEFLCYNLSSIMYQPNLANTFHLIHRKYLHHRVSTSGEKDKSISFSFAGHAL